MHGWSVEDSVLFAFKWDHTDSQGHLQENSSHLKPLATLPTGFSAAQGYSSSLHLGNT